VASVIHNTHQISDAVMEDDMNVQNTFAQLGLFSFAPTDEIHGTIAASI